jgi:hypothetical protein
VLRTPDGEYGLSSLLDNPWLKTCRSTTEQETSIARLDDLVSQELPDEPIGFVKIDVEGYELQVLKGATATIATHRPNLQIEIDPDHLIEVREWLAARGYTGLFFFDGNLFHVSEFRPEIHRSPDREWSPETADRFDANLFVVNFFFVPIERTTP